MEKFYVTTAIDYLNAEPHIGHAYQKIIADTLARWHRIAGDEVLFVTGTDEHGKKVENSAKELGKDTKAFVDEMSAKFKEAWDALDIVPDRFIRTTDHDHEETVKEFILRCNKSGDIYKGKYSGTYCVDCETYYTQKDLIDGKCPVHKKQLKEISEETYFFKLSKYKDFLINLYEENPDLLIPKSRKNEVLSRIKEGLRDLSITRTSFSWGVPFPLDKDHITYVWFDALINYYTATRDKGREDFWGHAVHILGKDNTWFHAVYWPAMLKSAGLKMPKKIISHGFLTFDKEKISKSLGNSIHPKDLVEKYGSDTIRYFCLRHFSFTSGSDGDFNESALIERHNNELANKYGNLVMRVLSLAGKYGMEKSNRKIELDLEKIKKLVNEFEVDKALNEIFAYIDRINEFVQKEKPWETQDRKAIYSALVGVRNATILLFPFIPKATKRLAEKIGFEISLKEIESELKIKNIQKIEPPFRKLEEKLNNDKFLSRPMDEKISYADFSKLDIKVAEIQNVEDIEGADKLYKLTISLGEEIRTICAGLKPYYSHDELKGKRIIVLANLEPRKIRGVESDGMLLAATNPDGSKVSLIIPDQEIEAGSKIS